VTRLHERALDIVATKQGDRWVLASPAPGWFFPSITHGDLVVRGHAIGELEVLGRRTRLVAPEVQGIVQRTLELAGRAPLDLLVPRAVGHGDPLVVLDSAAQLVGLVPGTVGAGDDERAASALVFRAPTSGRFYGRPSPDKPAFIAVGDELAPGTTICLLEVMKTFHRVTYGGAGLPERAKVRELLVADGADVTSGDPLLALE